MLEPVVIIGLAKSGESALALLLDMKIPRKNILTYDQKPGFADTSRPEDVLSFKPKTAIVSPGVPLSTPWIQELKNAGVQITSELTLAMTVIQNEKIIGITGSVGKSTTTAALGAAALAIDPNAFVGGNLGTPLSLYAHEVLAGLRPRANFIILELSSFQLENCEGLLLEDSIITFLSANHLERYQDLEHYYKTKLVITTKTKGTVFLNSAGGDLKSYLKNPPSKYQWVDQALVKPSEFDFSKANIIGSHNRDNLALAIALIKKYAWPEKCLHALLGFPGLAHRLQKVGEFNNVLFVNDSKATALDSVLTAHQSCVDLNRSGKIHLLLGGRDKNLPWGDLSVLSKSKKTQCYFFGECANKARQLSQLSGEAFPKLELALKSLFSQLSAGDVVLLSPGGTSMDEFKNFEDRGQFFSQAVLAFTKN